MPTVTTPTRDTALDVSTFWFRYRNELLAGLIVILVAVAGFGGYRLYQQRRDSAAAEMLATAKTIPEYQRVIAEYSGSQASASACLLLAAAQRNEKKFTEANATLQSFIDKFPRHELISTAHLGMATNLEAMGKPDEALSILQRLVANYPGSFDAPVAMLEEVRLLRAKNQIEEARRICENVLTQYRDSYLAGEATRQLRLMRPTGPATIPSPPAVAPPAPASPAETLPSNPPPPKPNP